uniref:SHSP domain-containing protein n=1 Tax=Kalanchoe fedtschenkoi TaxID=63787 RepID=A0A7N0TN46_KALFE
MSKKVHPIPKKRNITFRYDVASALSEAARLTNRQKKLRRLPHIFAKVLELPFRATADVSVHETPNSFRFAVAADADDLGSHVRAQAIEICPGVMKIVVRGDAMLADLSLDELEIDFWRFRLPECTRPEMATAACVDGELVVVVPKGEEAAFQNDDAGIWRSDGNGRLVIVQ